MPSLAQVSDDDSDAETSHKQGHYDEVDKVLSGFLRRTSFDPPRPSTLPDEPIPSPTSDTVIPEYHPPPPDPPPPSVPPEDEPVPSLTNDSAIPKDRLPPPDIILDGASRLWFWKIIFACRLVSFLLEL